MRWSPRRERRSGATGRWPAAALAVALLCGVAACGRPGGSGGSGGADITVWHGYTDVEARAITSLAAQWNRTHPHARVHLVFDGGNDSALQKTVTSGITGALPDLAYEYGSSVAPLARQPRLLDLTKVVREPGWDWSDFYPSERQAATAGGKVVGVPALVDDLALVYNKRLFAQAGVAPPTDTWSWAQFRAAAARLTDRSRHQYGWAYIDDGSEDTVWRWIAMLWQAGGKLLTTDDRHAAFDSPAGLAALTQLRDMAVVDRSVYLDSGNDDYLNVFNSGKIAMLWTGPWDLSSIAEGVDYGVTYLPGYDGDHQTISGPDMYVSFHQSAARDATTMAFLRWLTSAPVHLRFATATGDLPLRTSETQLPGYRAFLAKYPGDRVFVDNLDNVEQSRPTIGSYGQVSLVVGQMVQSVLLGEAQPAQALKTASAEVDQVLGQGS